MDGIGTKIGDISSLYMHNDERVTSTNLFIVGKPCSFKTVEKFLNSYFLIK
jgi:Ethanolamine utilization protein EutJ (predicted chaperonin)